MKQYSTPPALLRMKRVATSLLVVAALLLILAKSHHDAGAWQWLSAFAEAAMVGALADWFAIVALFRRPLGLPIPHTAILPNNKARIADTLAAFVRDKFLGTDALLAKLLAIDPATRVATWLSEPRQARVLADRIADMGAELIRFVDDERVKHALFDVLQKRLETLNVGRLIGQLLDILTEDGRHQLLLNEGIRRLSRTLDNPEIQKVFADRILAVAGAEYPKMLAALGLFGVSPEELGLKLAVALVNGFNRWLHEIGDDPSHERRQAFDETVRAFIERLKHDAQFQQRIDQAKNDLLAHPATRDYVGGLWDSARQRLLSGLAEPGSPLREGLADGLVRLGNRLLTSAPFRDSINAHFGAAVRALAPAMRETIATHIAETVRGWDDQAIAREVEHSVGRDLQFIRVNGTLVGGLVGLAIHGVLVATGTA